MIYIDNINQLSVVCFCDQIKAEAQMLTRLDKDTAINLEAIAFVKFSGDSDALEATVNFLGSTTSTVAFSGEAANTLSEMTNDPAEAPSTADRAEAEEPFADPFHSGFARTKAWYYYKRELDFLDLKDERRYFLAFVNAKGSCSIRTFDADTGRFESKKYYSGPYQEAFAGIIRDATELTIRSQPNLERDCRERLPEPVLADLKKQVKERLGTSNDKQPQEAL
jgi:hypothetical protein